jgi:predicted MFS family arabinose efflux permease
VTAPRSFSYTGYAVLLLFLANVENYSQRLVLSILLPAIKTDVSLTDGQLGVLMGGGFGLFYAIAGVPMARFAEQRGRIKWLSIALVFWSAATGWLGWARTFTQMLAARIALGVGQSLCIPTSHSLLTDYVKDEHRPFALGVHSTGGVVGATLCLIVGGYLEAHVGWRNALMLIASSGIALGVLVMATLREPERTRTGASLDPAPAVPLGAIVNHLLGLKSYVLVLVSVCFGMLIEFGLNQWLPSYYVRQFSLSVSDVGFRYGMAVACGGIPGSILGGLCVTALARRDIRWLAWFPAVMYALALPTGLSMLLVRHADLALLLNGLYAFLIFTTNGALWAACFVHVLPSMRATTSAITLLIAGLTGLTLGPALVGGLSDFWSSRTGTNPLQAALVSIEALAVCVVVSLLWAAGHLAGEHRARTKAAVEARSVDASLKESL